MELSVELQSLEVVASRVLTLVSESLSSPKAVLVAADVASAAGFVDVT